MKSDSELPRYGSRCQFRQDIPAAESKPLSEQDSIPIKFERSVPKKQYKDITVENDADGAAKFMVVSLKKTPQPSKVIADENFMQLAMNRAQQADNDGQIVHVIHLPAPGAQILNPENMDYSDILVDGQQKIITLQGNVNDPMLEMADESSKVGSLVYAFNLNNHTQNTQPVKFKRIFKHPTLFHLQCCPIAERISVDISMCHCFSPSNTIF